MFTVREARARLSPSEAGVAWEGTFRLENVVGDRMQVVDDGGVVVDDLDSPAISHRYPYQKVLRVEPWIVSAGEAALLRIEVERRRGSSVEAA